MKKPLIIKFDGVLSSASIPETIHTSESTVNIHDLEALSLLCEDYDVYIFRNVRYMSNNINLNETLISDYISDNYILYDSYEYLKHCVENIISSFEDNNNGDLSIFVGCTDEDVKLVNELCLRERSNIYGPVDSSFRFRECTDVTLGVKGGEGVLSELEPMLF